MQWVIALGFQSTHPLILLGNLSHFESNIALQGYSVWTEDVPGMTDNWFFVTPNIYGVRPDAGSGGPFNGIAIKL